MNLSFLNAFILNLLISALIPCTLHAANGRCENTLFNEFRIPRSYISTFNQRSKNITEYKAKKKFYYDTSIYRGFLREGNLNIEKAVRFLLEVDSDLVGNGVNASKTGLNRAFIEYNKRARNKPTFLEYFTKHLDGENELYWTSLLTSWSTSVDSAMTFTGPHNFATTLKEVPQEGFGIFVTALQPKVGLETSQMESRFGTQNQYPDELEVTIPVALDPEMISKITFWQYERLGPHMNISGVNLALQIERISMGVYELREGTMNTRIPEGQRENLNILRRFKLKIKPDLTYTIVPL